MTAAAGTRENPIEIIAPGDLDRAVVRVWRPTPGQASAGNYKMAHVVIGGWDKRSGDTGLGIEVSIETPLDGIRRGVGPDGTPWSVRMPAHYGYVKNTSGADGDHVDLYIGPDAHMAHRHPVWIVDQRDADTLDYDEHKCLVGFADRKAAEDAYIGGFSDGRGKDRIGAVTRMTYSEFHQWLFSGNTKQPLNYRSVEKALRSVEIHPSSCGCGGRHDAARFVAPSGGSEVSMTKTTDTAASPRTVGVLGKALNILWPSMKAEDRAALIADAQLLSSAALGKAVDLLHEGDDHERIGEITDHFDGAPDNELRTGGGHGPGSVAKPGDVNVGPAQMASGEGARRMESEYSRHATQGGVQRATDMLGAKLAANIRVVKALAGFGEAMSKRVELMETAVGALGTAPDASTFDALVAKAVAKAMPSVMSRMLTATIPMVVKAVSEAEEEEEGEEDEEAAKAEGEEDEEDDEAEEAESGSGTEIEITNEVDDEEDDEDEAAKAFAKAAAAQRLIAKSLLRLAKKAAMESEDAGMDGRHASGKRHHKKAEKRLAKARTYASIGKALVGKTAAKSKALDASMAALAKALQANKVKNQDNWPASKDTRVGKSTATPAAATSVTAATPAATPGAPSAADVAKAVDMVKAANEGTALLTASVQQLLAAVGGQSRDPGNSTPPVTALFKGAVPPSPEGQLNALVQDGVISAADRDRGIDALGFIKGGGVPQALIESQVNACAGPVQAVLRGISA